MPLEILIPSEEHLQSAAKKLLAAFPATKVFAFHGEMGSGKTTFIKAICRELGVVETMSSPTFALVNEYRTKANVVIFHFDFYRLTSEIEGQQAGLQEYLDSGNYCFVEWPEKAPGLLPGQVVNVEITVQNEKRILAITHN